MTRHVDTLIALPFISPAVVGKSAASGLGTTDGNANFTY